MNPVIAETLRAYGYGIDPEGRLIGRTGKLLSVAVTAKAGRYRMISSQTGRLLFTFPLHDPAAIGKFLEKFYFAEVITANK